MLHKAQRNTLLLLFVHPGCISYRAIELPAVSPVMTREHFLASGALEPNISPLLVLSFYELCMVLLCTAQIRWNLLHELRQPAQRIFRENFQPAPRNFHENARPSRVSNESVSVAISSSAAHGEPQQPFEYTSTCQIFRCFCHCTA